jgi:glycosyltransferase involved in cell wall biosynthesis
VSKQDRNHHVILDGRTANDHFPGIGRYVVNLAQALVSVAPQLSLSLLYDPNVAASRLSLPNLPRIACPTSPFSLRQQWLVPRQLPRAQATLYHSPYYLMPYRPGVPTLLTCYDMLPLLFPEYYTSWQRIVYRLTHLLALRAAAVVLAISEATKADMVRCLGVSPERVIVTPLAAGPHFQPQDTAIITAVRQKYRLPEPYILYVGSNKPHKNLPRLVRAFAQFAIANHPSKIALVIAGHWDDRYPEAKKVAEERNLQDRVRFAGPVAEADLPALYSGAILFIFPSRYEGFGLPVLEAMACGLPVACANESSLPEVAGQAALLFQPDDTQAISAAIADLLGNPERRRALARRGLDRAAEFSWQRTAVLTLEVYQMMLSKGRNV